MERWALSLVLLIACLPAAVRSGIAPVRMAGSAASGHLTHAHHLPLVHLPSHAEQLIAGAHHHPPHSDQVHTSAHPHPVPPRQHVWIQRRPDGTQLGPDRLRCMAQRPVTFYLLEEVMFDCDVPLDADFLLRLGGGVKHSGELFFYDQLKDHPWRTRDPEAATLVVVPLFLGMLARGICPEYRSESRQQKALSKAASWMKAWPRYKQSLGADFLLLTTDWQGGAMVNEHNTFSKVARNFIFAYKQTGDNTHMPSGTKHGEMCIIPVPTTITYLMRHCSGSTQGGITCPDRELEASFPEFLAKRDRNMFFMGKTSKRRYRSRRAFIKECSDLAAPDGVPNFLVAIQDINATHIRNPPGPVCDGPPENYNGCVNEEKTGANYNLYEATLQRSRLAIMIAGMDPSSTRFFDHIYEGSPQLMLSDKYYESIFPFRCRLSQAEMVYTLQQDTFMKHPKRTVRHALRELYANNATLLEEMWRTQMHARKELLWQVPGSKVAENVLHDAVRRCFTG